MRGSVALVLAAGMAFAEVPINIGSRREVMWDDHVIDAKATTASRVLHAPEYVGPVMTHDAPWEGDCSGYHNILLDRDEKGDLLRMYYLGLSIHMVPPEQDEFSAKGIRVCYAESRDGISWTKPKLGLRAFNGSTENNILMDESEVKWDNFMVFKDENPACPPDERYKAVARTKGFRDRERINPKGPELGCYLSADGIHFRKGWTLLRDCAFDTLNVGFWDAVRGEYHLYVRGFHRLKEDRYGDLVARDILHSVSKDFKTWTPPRHIAFAPAADGRQKDDYPLYTNVVQPYPRAPHVLVGFPTRYVERPKWTPTYDRLPSPELRRWRMDRAHKGEPRYGLALTDCVFMMSRDGDTFARDEDAFMRPGPERDFTWLYGDCYLARGLVETAARRGRDRELALYAPVRHWCGRAALLERYALRLDGFVSRHGTYEPQRVTTKRLVYAGDELRINFSTSARGFLRVAIRDDAGRTLESHELFGDAVDRAVDFLSGSPSDLAGKPVTLAFTLSDADIYSFRFVPRGGTAE